MQQSVQMRRLVMSSSAVTKGTKFRNFMFPHSFNGTNNAFNNVPVVEKE